MRLGGGNASNKFIKEGEMRQREGRFERKEKKIKGGRGKMKKKMGFRGNCRKTVEISIQEEKYGSREEEL